MAFKTNIIQNEEFYHQFLNEIFFGRHRLSGDDKNLTRYILNKGYDTYHQLNNSCCLSTTFESGTMHFKQAVRWSSNTIVSDFTLLFIEKKIWKLKKFTSFILLDKFFTPFYSIYGLIIIPLYSILRTDYVIFLGWCCWLLCSRGLKLLPHFNRKPTDIFYLPIYIVYQYLLIFLRLYSVVLIYKGQNHWSNRPVAMINNQLVRTGTNCIVIDGSNIDSVDNSKTKLEII
jgi:hypothetical protein